MDVKILPKRYVFCWRWPVSCPDRTEHGNNQTNQRRERSGSTLFMKPNSASSPSLRFWAQVHCHGRRGGLLSGCGQLIVRGGHQPAAAGAQCSRLQNQPRHRLQLAADFSVFTGVKFRSEAFPETLAALASSGRTFVMVLSCAADGSVSRSARWGKLWQPSVLWLCACGWERVDKT
eukprot:scaffold1226_cov250-Pinguiococcus_pyrenoidosus.AAC.5